MARRANDPDLLRAQAQAGHDGENAYRASKQQLVAQRQAAVKQAMQEAALRGAPAGAIAQIQGQVSSPYNQAIRATTQSAGAYSADMAAREGRSYDYNQAILAARQLIPAQIQSAVAPIRAQNRFQLQSIRQEGQNRIGEIEASTALQLAQMEADERMRRQREAASAAANRPTLTQSELAASLETGAAGVLNQLQGSAQGTISANQQALATDPNVAQTMAQAIAAREAARWGYAATVGETARQDMLGAPGQTGLSPIRPAPLGAGQTPVLSGQPGDTEATVNRWLEQMGQSYLGGPDKTYLDTRGQPQNVPPPYVATTAFGGPGYSLPADLPQAPEKSYESIGQVPGLPELIGQYGTASYEHQQAEAPFFSTETGLLTQSQLEQLAKKYGDTAAPLLDSAMDRPITGGRDIAEIVGGQPTPLSTAPGPVVGGQVRPSATESFRQAQELSASQLLRQGYDITSPELQLGMAANRGRTLADVNAEEQGQLPIRDQVANEIESRVAAGEDYQTARDKAADDLRQQNENDMVQAIYNEGDISYSEGLGPLETVYNIVAKDPINSGYDDAYQRVQARLQELVASGESYDVEAALDAEQVFNPLLRRLIQAALG